MRRSRQFRNLHVQIQTGPNQDLKISLGEDWNLTRYQFLAIKTFLFFQLYFQHQRWNVGFVTRTLHSVVVEEVMDLCTIANSQFD